MDNGKSHGTAQPCLAHRDEGFRVPAFPGGDARGERMGRDFLLKTQILGMLPYPMPRKKTPRLQQNSTAKPTPINPRFGRFPEQEPPSRQHPRFSQKNPFPLWNEHSQQVPPLPPFPLSLFAWGLHSLQELTLSTPRGLRSPPSPVIPLRARIHRQHPPRSALMERSCHSRVSFIHGHRLLGLLFDKKPHSHISNISARSRRKTRSSHLFPR